MGQDYQEGGSKCVYTTESLDAWRAKATKPAERRSGTSWDNDDAHLLQVAGADAK